MQPALIRNVPYFDLKAQYASLREEIFVALGCVCRNASRQRERIRVVILKVAGETS